MTAFHLGVNLSMIFKEVPLIERFALAKKMGFNTVEIQFPYELSIAEIQQQLTQHQLQLCLINVPAGDLMQGGLGLACHPHKITEYRQAVQQAIDYAQALGVSKINVLSGKVDSSLDWHLCWNTFIDNLSYTVEQCKNTAIQVVFEMINPIDMPNFLIHNVSLAGAVLEQVPQCQLQFDSYHFAKIGEPVLIRLQQLLDKIGHIQFADHPNRHQPDTAEIDFEQFFNFLKHSNYQGFVCAEYNPSENSLQSFAWKDKYF